MTLRDPLLQDLKSRIGALVLSGSGGPFNENEELVISLCLSLERVFCKGILRRDGFTPWKADAFQWFYQLVRKYQRTIPLVFKVAFEEVLGNSKTKTPLGKLRLLIRTCLKRRCLYVPVQCHVENEDYGDLNARVTYAPDSSILGHEILSQILLSLVQQLSLYAFPFDLANSAFLDESWQLGVRVKVDMVPCERLGLTLGFPMGFPLIVQILKNSCAAEIEDLIAVGDVLDEINGVFLRHCFGSKLDALFRKVRTAPFQMTFIKGVNPKSGQVYLPLITLYRILGLDPEVIASHGSPAVPPVLPGLTKEQPLPNPKELPPERMLEEADLLCLDDQDHAEQSDGPAIVPLREEIGSDSFIFGDSLLTSNPLDLLTPESENPTPFEQQKERNIKNDSSASALNLQRYQPESDQLIV